jgi:hypothetical protein
LIEAEVGVLLFRLQAGDLFAGGDAETVGDALLEVQQHRVQVARDLERQLTEVRLVLFVAVEPPVIGVAFQRDALPADVLAEHERAGADEVGGLAVRAHCPAERAVGDEGFVLVLGQDLLAGDLVHDGDGRGRLELDGVVVDLADLDNLPFECRAESG